MPIARVNDKILFFVHIPKTGGTSVEEYLQRIGHICLAGKNTQHYSKATPKHMERQTFEQFVPAEFYDHGFTIIRDPLQRMKSEFGHQRNQMAGRSGAALLARILPRRRRQGLGTRIARSLADGNFDAWVPAMFEGYQNDPYFRDNHIRPQADFVANGHEVFRFEGGLDQVLSWINERCGVNEATAAVPHEKQSAGTAFSASEGTQNLVRQFYRPDYDLLASLPRRDKILPI